MKALILNSGIGKRLSNKKTCKCLAELDDGVTILDAQLSALLNCGIYNICMTTGPFAGMLEKHAREHYPQAHFEFINNPRYESTNYIYSIYLAKEHLCGTDILLLHGDLLFEQSVLQDIIASKHSTMAVDMEKPLPEKDFKARIADSHIVSVGVSLFDSSVYSQPLYKLLERDWNIWQDEIERFCKNGVTDVYAEDAFNEVSSSMNVLPFDITGRICCEIDNDDDLAYAQAAYKLMPERKQTIITGYGSRERVKELLNKTGAQKPLAVNGISADTIREFIDERAVLFYKFSPNPVVDEINAGKKLFRDKDCDFLISIGGGSAIDTAKCIKNENPHIQHLAIPTTAGTGSESTCFAVIYKDGVKHSVDNEQILPEYVILDPFFLKTLPEYHKKSTLLDALCQSIESLWAKGKTAASMSYARSAGQTIRDNATGYLAGDLKSAERILYAANLSGKAINISRTTAAHAMSYKLSTMFSIAHGHAVALCLVPVWRHLLKTGSAPDELSGAELDRFVSFYETMEMELPADFSKYPGDDSLLHTLAVSVNTERLNNHPVALTYDELLYMYDGILNKLRAG